MEKQEIIEKLCQELQLEIADKERSLETIKQAVWEAPGRMESRYDSTKTEMSWLADSLNMRLREIRIYLKKLKWLKPDPCDRICEGALITCCRDRKTTHYFIVDGGQGCKVKTPTGTVTCMSTAAPLYQAMRGLSPGSHFRFRDREITIVSLK